MLTEFVLFQCLVHKNWGLDSDLCAANPANCPDGLTFSIWEKNPFFDVNSLVLYGQSFSRKCLVCNGAYADVKTALTCPGFGLWREVAGMTEPSGPTLLCQSICNLKRLNRKQLRNSFVLHLEFFSKMVFYFLTRSF